MLVTRRSIVPCCPSGIAISGAAAQFGQSPKREALLLSQNPAIESWEATKQMAPMYNFRFNITDR